MSLFRLALKLSADGTKRRVLAKNIGSDQEKLLRPVQRVSQPGVLLQMDGSYHKWFGGKESCLITAIDDCNNDLYYAGFYQSESRNDVLEGSALEMAVDWSVSNGRCLRANIKYGECVSIILLLRYAQF